MECGNSIELTTQHAGKKQDKALKGKSIIEKIKSEIPEEALKLFEGGKR